MADDRTPPNKPPASPNDEPASLPGTFTFKRTFSFGRPPPDDPGVTVVQGPVRKFEWKWGGPPSSTETKPEQPQLEGEPATYYEALSGRPDPNREFFVTGRRLLNGVVTVVATGIPVALVILGIASGADLQTIVVFAIAGAVVGLMLKSTFPRTPFG